MARNPYETPIGLSSPESGVAEKETPESKRARLMQNLRRSAAVYGLAFIGVSAAIGYKNRDDFAILWDYCQPLKLTEPETGMPSNEVMLETLDEKVGSVRLDLVRQRLRHEKANSAAGETKVEGFEAAGIKAADLRAYMAAAFPPAWSRPANIGSIKVDPHFVPMAYPGFENLPEYGHCSVPFNGGPVEISLTSEKFKEKEQEENLKFLFSDVLAHEFAHANDWRSSPELTQEDSLQLRFRVMQASQDQGRPRFWYPEGIKAKPGKEKSANDERATEYFAELISSALGPSASKRTAKNWETWVVEYSGILTDQYDASQEQAVENARLVKWYFNKIDSAYAPWKAFEERLKTEHKVISDYRWTRFKELAQAIADAELRREIEYGLDQGKASFTEKELKYMKTKSGSQMTEELQIARRIPGDCAQAFQGWKTLLETARRTRSSYWEKDARGDRTQEIENQINWFARQWKKVPEAKRLNLRKSFIFYARITLTGTPKTPKTRI
ncbi:MAG: hypothetical protein WC641_05665 [Patescibacteria group bacterium]